MPSVTATANRGLQGSLRDQLRRIEAEIIYQTLAECGDDRKAAAQRLEIGLSSLYRKLEEFSDTELAKSESA